MSDDMLDYCGAYNEASSCHHKNSDYFFPAQNGASIVSARMNAVLNECWSVAHPGIKDLPGIRVYDLRHRFASAALFRWIDEGRDLYAMLPYLSAY